MHRSALEQLECVRWGRVLLQTSAALHQPRKTAGNLGEQIVDILVRRWWQLSELGRRRFFGLEENAIGQEDVEMHVGLKR